MKLKVVVRRGPRRDGYVASSPVLPAFRAPGNTPREAVEALQETLQRVFAELNERAAVGRDGAEMVEIEV